MFVTQAISISDGLTTLADTLYSVGFPDSSVKESICRTGDPGSIPGSRSAEKGIGYPLQYSGVENSMNCIVHGVAKSQTE